MFSLWLKKLADQTQPQFFFLKSPNILLFAALSILNPHSLTLTCPILPYPTLVMLPRPNHPDQVCPPSPPDLPAKSPRPL